MADWTCPKCGRDNRERDAACKSKGCTHRHRGEPSGGGAAAVPVDWKRKHREELAKGAQRK
jgi:hypothetical protein